MAINSTLVHHGTSNEAEKSILRSRKFKLSSENNEWLGHGVYFFCDKNSIENGIKWAKYVKKFLYYSILEVKIDINEDKILDLDDGEWQEFFHEYREKKLLMYKKKGINIEKEFNNVLKLDCKIIDELVEEMGFDLVKQRRYIELRKRTNQRLIASNIPNCCMLCVKNINIINEESIECIERGVNK